MDNELSIEYIAGLMDADGSFNISISKSRYINKTGTAKPQFSFVVNFRQLDRAKDILEGIQEVLAVGKIYKHSHAGMLTWQTTSAYDTRIACLRLLPYLHIKKQDCALLLEAVTLWLDSPRTTNGGRPGVSDEIKSRVIDISTRMNTTQQKETSRRNKEIREISIFGIQTLEGVLFN